MSIEILEKRNACSEIEMSNLHLNIHITRQHYRVYAFDPKMNQTETCAVFVSRSIFLNQEGHRLRNGWGTWLRKDSWVR